jgi:hypothetical protein
MGWASRAHVGRWERLQQRLRRERLAHNLLPRLIWLYVMHLAVALVLFPFRLVRHLWRNYAAAQRLKQEDRV